MNALILAGLPAMVVVGSRDIVFILRWLGLYQGG